MTLCVRAVVVPGAGASTVDPLPCMLGDDSSKYEGDVVRASSASAFASEETTSIKVGRSGKAQHLEESEAKSKERPSSVLPQGSEAMATSSRAMGIRVLGFIVEPLHLGNSILSACCVLLFFAGLLICFLFVS